MHSPNVNKRNKINSLNKRVITMRILDERGKFFCLLYLLAMHFQGTEATEEARGEWAGELGVG